MAVISDRRPVINTRHWLYPEIAGLWIPIAGGRVLANLVHPGRAESTLQSKGNAGQHRADTLLAGDTVSSSDYTYKGGFLTPALRIPAPCTLAWFGDVYGARSGNYNRIFGLEDTVGLNSSIEFQRNADDTSVNFHYEDNAFNGPEAQVTGALVVGRRQSLFGVLRVGGVSPFCFTYYNGIAGATNNTFPTNGLTANSQVVIGALTSNTTGYTNFGMHLGLWVARDLWDWEVRKLHASPESLYIQPWRQPRFFVPTAPTVTTPALGVSTRGRLRPAIFTPPLVTRSMLTNPEIPMPPPVPGYFGWWDASVAGSVIKSAGDVSEWRDLSPSAYHLTATGTARPTTGTRTLNGLNVLDFDGTTDVLAIALVTQAQPVTVFSVVQADTSTGTRVIFGFSTGAGSPTFYYLSNAYNLYAGGNNAVGTVDTAAHVLSTVWNGASTNVYVDGTAPAGAFNSGSLGWSASPLTVGSSDSPATNFWDGVIAEILAYPSALSDPDRQLVEAHLKTKWGIA